jgi:hypothetical protein
MRQSRWKADAVASALLQVANGWLTRMVVVVSGGWVLAGQERKPVGEVAGANAPHLEQLIKQHCPPPPNDDEEN